MAEHLTAAAEALDAAAVAPEACEATAARLRELAAEVLAPAARKAGGGSGGTGAVADSA